MPGGPTAPKAIVTLEDLRIHLQAAVELEHATIPPYLAALYTIRDGFNPSSHLILRSVVMEEMLHMALAANVLNAIGGAPAIAQPNFVPAFPAKLPVGRNQPIEVHIRRFSPEAIATFLDIEYPRRPVGPAAGAPLLAVAPGELQSLLANGSLYASIGDFYEAVVQGLRSLEAQAQAKGATLFTGDPARQVFQAGVYFGGGGRLFAVTNLDTALAALKQIVDQGEGYADTLGDGDDVVSQGKFEVAHYYRFKEIAAGREYAAGDKPNDPPSGAPIAVDWSDAAVWPMIDDPAPEIYADPAVVQTSVNFTATYSFMLEMLHRAFNGQPEKMDAAFVAMMDVGSNAKAIIHTPIGGGLTGNAGPCFRYTGAPLP